MKRAKFNEQREKIVKLGVDPGMVENYQKAVKLGIAEGDKSIFRQPNIRFYYVNIKPDENGNPTKGVASVCVIRVPVGSPQWTGASKEDIYCRGLSFCMPSDQFCKEDGRVGALGRAIQAVENKKSKNPILKRVTALLAQHQDTILFKFYSEYNPVLTMREFDQFQNK